MPITGFLLSQSYVIVSCEHNGTDPENIVMLQNFVHTCATIKPHIFLARYVSKSKTVHSI